MRRFVKNRRHYMRFLEDHQIALPVTNTVTNARVAIEKKESDSEEPPKVIPAATASMIRIHHRFPLSHLSSFGNLGLPGVGQFRMTRRYFLT